MRYCGNCGQPLLPAPGERPLPGTALAAPEEHIGVMMGADLLERMRRAGLEAAGQQRHVTVLFADLAGYTQLAAQLDNEDLYDLMGHFLRALIDEVYQYEGIVDKLIGDGLMALFGAPIAHENNAERALRAALGMQASLAELNRRACQRLGVELHLRVGLHSGQVVVGGIGANMLMDYTAIGDTVNLAHRLEEAAAQDTILVSEAVYRQTRSLFTYEALPPLHLKGISQPIKAYRLLGPKVQPGRVRGLEGLRAPMVGRDRELDLLRHSILALSGHNQGGFIWISGEAGIGKSRLVAEFKAHLPPSVRALEGSSLTYRRSVSYWLFLDLLRNYLGLRPDMDEAQVSQRLTQAVYQALGERASELLPYLEYIFSLRPSNPSAAERLRYLEASQLRQQIFLAVRDLLLAETQRQPLVLILEDLHWADEASLDLLQFLAEAVRHTPMLILAVSRQTEDRPLERLIRWAGRYLSERFIPIHLRNLSTEESHHLLMQLLSVPDFPEHLRQMILERADGVPFYLEEILRMLIDGGILQKSNGQWRVVGTIDGVQLGVPETLQELILARFDRLPPFQRRLLQVAAVIGHQFQLRLLTALLPPEERSGIDQALKHLVQREFIVPLAGPPNAAYAFRHVLMSEAIYATLLKRQRSQLHGQVGEAIEQLYAERLEEHVELLARHYSWSPRLDRALHYLIAAGQKAASSFINEQALFHFNQALDLLPKVPHTPLQAMHVHLGLGDVQSLVGNYTAAFHHYEAALAAIAAEAGETFMTQRSALQRKIARTLERQGDYEGALSRLSLALQTLNAISTPPSTEKAQILSDIGWIHFRQGNFVEAEKLLGQALSLVENSHAYDVIASIYNRLGGVAYNQGDWNRTADYLRKSIAIRESIGDLVGLATSFNNLGLLSIEMGDFDNALENLTRSYELKSRLGQAEGVSMALNNLGWLRIQRGELDEAARCLNQALELARQIGYTSLIAEVLKNQGELHLKSRAWDEARNALSEAAQILSELGTRDQLVDTYTLLGEAALGAGDLDAAQSCMDKIQNLSISLADDTRELSTVQRGEFWRFRGMLAIHQGEWESATQYLKISEKIFQSLNSRLHQGRAAYQLGVLAEVQGDVRTARLRYREAALLFRSVGARLDQKGAEEAYQRLSL